MLLIILMEGKPVGECNPKLNEVSRPNGSKKRRNKCWE